MQKSKGERVDINQTRWRASGAGHLSAAPPRPTDRHLARSRVCCVLGGAGGTATALDWTWDLGAGTRVLGDRVREARAGPTLDPRLAHTCHVTRAACI